MKKIDEVIAEIELNSFMPQRPFDESVECVIVRRVLRASWPEQPEVMRKTMDNLITDKREIYGLFYNSNTGTELDWQIGEFGLSEIVAYCEIDNSPWFALYDDEGGIRARIPASAVTVIYNTEKKTKQEAEDENT